MGKGVYKVSKKKWYEETVVKYEVFRNSERDKDSYYYIKDKERIYINDSELIKKYVENNKKLKNMYGEGNKKFLKTMTAYKKENNIFEKIDIKNSTDVLYRKFSEKRREKNLPDIYKDEIVIRATITFEKSSKPEVYREDKKSLKPKVYKKDEKGEYYFYKMNIIEEELTKARGTFIEELEEKLNMIFISIKNNGYKYDSEKLEISKSICEAVMTIDKYNLCKEIVKNEKIDLVDENSINENIFQPTSIHKKLLKKIINYLKNKEKNKERLEIELKKYFDTTYRLLKNKLNIYKETTLDSKRATVNIIKDSKIEYVKDEVEKAIKEYKLKSLIKKILKDEKDLKNKKDSKGKVQKFAHDEIEIFNIIKEHYNQTFKEWKYADNGEKKYYIKYIHRYMLGRAKKIKQILKENGEIKFTKIKMIFDESELKIKIFNSIKNKIIVKKVEDSLISKYAAIKLSEGTKPILKVIDTLKLKLIKSVYEAVVTGISEIKEYDEIFSKATLGELEAVIKENINGKKIEDKKIIFIKMAYLLRNYSLHNQVFNLKASKNKEDLCILNTEFLKSYCDKNLKDKLLEYELKKLKSNNCFEFISLELLEKIFDEIDINSIKPNYLPRFSKIYRCLSLNSKEDLRSISEEERKEEENSVFYAYSLIYNYGFEKLSKEIIENYDEKKEIEKFIIDEKDLKELKEKGIAQYKQEMIIQKQGKVDEIRKFEQKYIKIVGEIFRKILEKKDIIIKLIGEKNKNSSEVEGKIKEKLEKKLVAPDKNFNLLFLKSIYGTVLLGTNDVKNEISQTLQRFISLVESLRIKYNCKDINMILKEILKLDNILDENDSIKNFMEELNNLIQNINCKIKIENFTKEVDNEKVYFEDFSENVLKAYNLGKKKNRVFNEIGKIFYIRESKNQIEGQKVYPFAGEKVEEQRLILPNNFFKNECGQKTLGYIVEKHILAMEKIGLDYKKVLDKISYYNKLMSKEELEKEEMPKKIEISIPENDILNKTKIQYYMEMKRNIQNYFKKEAEANDKKGAKDVKYNKYYEYFENKINDEEFIKIAKKLVSYNDSINEYNFYQRVMNLNQLIANKKLYREYLNRMMVWTLQGEKIGISLGGVEKKKIFKKLEEFQSEKYENSNSLRNDICHLNIYQKNPLKKEEKEEIKTIYKKFENFNSYDMKKRNEVRKIETKILENHNIVKIKNIDSKDNCSYYSKWNNIYSEKNKFKFNLENISKIEVKYMLELLGIQSKVLEDDNNNFFDNLKKWAKGNKI
ncbi:MAG: hypothetical protein ACRC6K_04270 [Fusobacteriaceae bacterium]